MLQFLFIIYFGSIYLCTISALFLTVSGQHLAVFSSWNTARTTVEREIFAV